MDPDQAAIISAGPQAFSRRAFLKFSALTASLLQINESRARAQALIAATTLYKALRRGWHAASQ